jgi:hypothetical protein
MNTIRVGAAVQAIVDQIKEFGQTPSQLFTTPHPQRRTRASVAAAAGVAAAAVDATAGATASKKARGLFGKKTGVPSTPDAVDADDDQPVTPAPLIDELTAPLLAVGTEYRTSCSARPARFFF